MTVISVRPTKVPGRHHAIGIDSGATVSGGKWGVGADLINNLRMGGGQLVCATAINHTITSGSNHTMRFRVWPRATNTRAVWVVFMSSTAATAVASVTLTGDTDSAVFPVAQQVTTLATPFTSLSLAPMPIIFEEDHSALAATSPTEMTLDVAAADADVIVQSIACFEVPRVRAEVGGSELIAGNVAAGFAITDGLDHALYGIAAAAEDWKTTITRKAFDWYSPTPFENATTTFNPVFVLPPRVLMPRFGTAAGVTGAIRWAALVGNAGGSSEVRATAASGGTSTLSAASGAAAWVSGTLTVDREDLTTDMGGQTGRDEGDAITFDVRRVSGGTAQLYGLAVACAPA